MAKDPAFLFYPGDWLGGTMHMNHLEKGCYMDLLILQFNKGAFSLAQAKHMLNTSFDLAWPTVSEKFKLVDGMYLNERLEQEKTKRSKFSESRRNNAKGTKKPKNNPVEEKKEQEHMHRHMENENENRNKLNKIGIAEFLLLQTAKDADPIFYEFVSVYKNTLLKCFPNDFMQIQTMLLAEFSSNARELVEKYGIEDVKKVFKTVSESDFWKPKLYNLGSISKNFMAIKNLQIAKPKEEAKKSIYKSPAPIDFSKLE